MKTLLFLLLAASSLSAAVPPTSPFVNTSDAENSIRLALSRLPSNGGTVYVTRDATPPGTVYIPSNVQIVCLPNVTITQTNPNVDIFAAVGSTHFALKGCKTVGGRTAFSAFNISDYVIDDNWFTGYKWGVKLGMPATSGIIRHNRFSNCAAGCQDAIYVEDNGGPLTIEDNELDNSGAANDGAGHGAHGIAVHTFAVNGSSTALHIVKNRLIHYGGNFAIEVGSFGLGAMPSQVVIDGNSITLPVQNNGGISLGSVFSADVTNNHIDLSGLEPLIDGIEVVDSEARVIGNSVANAGPGARALAIDSASKTLVQNNHFQGFLFLVNSGTVVGDVALSDNTIIGNYIEVPAGSTWLYGIWQQCNVDGCTATNNTFGLNRIVGIGLPSSVGIYLEGDKGLIDSTHVFRNITTGFDSPFEQSATNVTNTEQQ